LIEDEQKKGVGCDCTRILHNILQDTQSFV